MAHVSPVLDTRVSWSVHVPRIVLTSPGTGYTTPRHCDPLPETMEALKNSNPFRYLLYCVGHNSDFS